VGPDKSWKILNFASFSLKNQVVESLIFSVMSLKSGPEFCVEFNRKYLHEWYIWCTRCFLLKLYTRSYLSNRIGHEIGTEKVLNSDYVIFVVTFKQHLQKLYLDGSLHKLLQSVWPNRLSQFSLGRPRLVSYLVSNSWSVKILLQKSAWTS